jgi:hypothetical protein
MPVRLTLISVRQKAKALLQHDPAATALESYAGASCRVRHRGPEVGIGLGDPASRVAADEVMNKVSPQEFASARLSNRGPFAGASAGRGVIRLSAGGPNALENAKPLCAVHFGPCSPLKRILSVPHLRYTTAARTASISSSSISSEVPMPCASRKSCAAARVSLPMMPSTPPGLNPA